MAINFNKDSVFNLKPLPRQELDDGILDLLVDGERIVTAFKTVRDQLIFTNKRIVSIDIQVLTGTRKSYSTLPYSKVQFFTIQTPGLAEIVPDSELYIMFTNGFTATFEFKGEVNIGAIGKMLSNYVLNQNAV